MDRVKARRNCLMEQTEIMGSGSRALKPLSDLWAGLCRGSVGSPFSWSLFFSQVSIDADKRKHVAFVFLSLVYFASHGNFQFCPCLRVIIAMMGHHDQSNLGRKGFICLIPPYHSSSLTEGRAGTWKQRPWRGSPYWLTAYWLAQPAFLYNLGPTSQWWHYPPLAGPSPTNY